MIKINQAYQNILVDYFDKNLYDTNEILKDISYSFIHRDIKDFLENLSFESNGKISNETLFSTYENNENIIENFFSKLELKFGTNKRDIFLDTNENTPCNFSTSSPDEQVKCIKKFILFKYTKMYKNMRNIHGKYLIESADLHICPYCARNYIGIVESGNGSKIIAPDLDHFYPKSRYPFLAVTLSNLLPSCLFCNQRAKSDIDFYKSAIYPPNKIFDDIEFGFDVYLNKIYIKNYAQLIAHSGYKTLLDTFLIQETYATHTEVLKIIINKTLKYRKSKIEDIASYTVGLSVSDIKKIVFYEYEFMNKKKELLWKMKKDFYKAIVK